MKKVSDEWNLEDRRQRQFHTKGYVETDITCGITEQGTYNGYEDFDEMEMN